MGKEHLDGVPVDVYRNDDVWPGSVVLTYVRRSSGELMRLFFDQPFNDWYMDIVDVTPVDENAWGGTFDVPANLAALPCP